MTVMNNEDPADPSMHEPRVTGAPEALWLVYGDLERDATHAECVQLGDVTWCEDAQGPADVRYVRADLAGGAQALAHALKVLLCDAEEADYMTGREREIFARQALADFGA